MHALVPPSVALHAPSVHAHVPVGQLVKELDQSRCHGVQAVRCNNVNPTSLKRQRTLTLRDRNMDSPQQSLWQRQAVGNRTRRLRSNAAFQPSRGHTQIRLNLYKAQLHSFTCDDLRKLCFASSPSCIYNLNETT